MPGGWSKLLEDARANRGRLPYALRAYSEFMPPPYVGVKPYGEPDPFTIPEGDDLGWNVSEYEWHFEIRPGIERIATRVLEQVVRLARGEPTQFSARMLQGNPSWPAALAIRTGAAQAQAHSMILPVSLSKTQDDKGRVRWTLFGTSPRPDPLWILARSLTAGEEDGDAPLRLGDLIAWATGMPAGSLIHAKRDGLRVLPFGEQSRALVNSVYPGLAYSDEEALGAVRILLAFRSFRALPPRVQWAYLEGRIQLVPSPESMVLWGHMGYWQLGRKLPWAQEIPLLQLFGRSNVRDPLRVPQTGWLDELSDEQSVARDRHRRANTLQRTHRWQRVGKDDEDAPPGAFEDKVTAALFSVRPDDLHLYGKPMARNCQAWTEPYSLLLNGPEAEVSGIRRAEEKCRAGGRFGYTMFYPPMRVGRHAAFWYIPVVARWEKGTGARVWPGLLPGVVVAHGPRGERISVRMLPRVLQRPPQRDSIELFQREPADQRQTGNCRRLLEWRELLQRPLPPAFARALLDASKEEDFAEWLAKLPARSNDPAQAAGLVESLKSLLGPEDDLGPAITFASTRTRDFEERYWKTIAFLTEGDFRDKNNADAVTANTGRTGGAKAAGRPPAQVRHLDRVADWLHAQYAALFQQHGMTGRAVCADHWFKWETDFDFSWSESWRRNQTGEQRERNVIVVIPGQDHSKAVVMADHYDTAYMEDVYDPARGGDRFRAAAAGADDNHSATAALLLAADVLLPLARKGKLERDVWLVHLTGEEFPADCLGARALASALVEAQGEGKLVLEAPGGRHVDVTKTRVVGAYVLDMVAHNRDNDRDPSTRSARSGQAGGVYPERGRRPSRGVFQIAPGEGRSSARLAWIAWRANQRWNRSVKDWNQGPDRRGKGRGRRVESGATVPAIAEHLALLGEVRPEWDPRSALYNTDGQIFSDLGIPVVLFMENYDIRRSGYHDTQDTMNNIDLDYGAALVAIAIESVAEAAGAPPSA